MFRQLVILSIFLFFLDSGVHSNSVTKRQSGDLAVSHGSDVIGGVIGSILDGQIVPESDGWGCAYGSRVGCHRGYCWAGCDATAVNGEWCYTTRGFSQDYRYIPCTNNNECDRCWRCAGPCSI